MQKLDVGTQIVFISNGKKGVVSGKRKGRKPVLIFRRDGYSQYADENEIEEGNTRWLKY